MQPVVLLLSKVLCSFTDSNVAIKTAISQFRGRSFAPLHIIMCLCQSSSDTARHTLEKFYTSCVEIYATAMYIVHIANFVATMTQYCLKKLGNYCVKCTPCLCKVNTSLCSNIKTSVA